MEIRMGKEVGKVTRFKCQVCETLYYDVNDAVECCANMDHEIEEVESFICPNCGLDFDTKDEAQHCDCRKESDKEWNEAFHKGENEVD